MHRWFVTLAWASLSVLLTAEPVYFGTYTAKGSKGIYRAEFDPRTGTLSQPELAVSANDPSFVIIHPAKPYAYAVDEGGNKVSAFQIVPGSGALKLINQEDAGGGPCHLALDATGRMLAVANYGDGSYATFPVRADGGLGKRASYVKLSGKGPDAARQEAPHAHSVTFTPDNRFLLMDDLGTDRTMVFRVHPETAQLEAASTGMADAGAGPRHLAIDPKGRFVYVLNEMKATVTRFGWDGKQGTLKKVDTVSSLPASFHGENTAAEIAIGRDGRTLYTSNRGHDSIAVFRVEPDGTLRLLGNVPSGGKEPRNFALDSTGGWLLAANQNSGNVVVFRLDRTTGMPTATGQQISISQPVSIAFAK